MGEIRRVFVLRHPEHKLAGWDGQCFTEHYNSWQTFAGPQEAYEANPIGVPCLLVEEAVLYEQACRECGKGDDIDPDKIGKWVIRARLHEFAREE